jgi:hypothetical protein
LTFHLEMKRMDRAGLGAVREPDFLAGDGARRRLCAGNYDCKCAAGFDA